MASNPEPVRLSLVKLEHAATRFNCGHIEGSCDIMQVVEFSCYHCDPEGAVLRVLFEIRERGIWEAQLSDDDVRIIIAGAMHELETGNRQ